MSSETDQISCDTEQTEELKFSDLETEVKCGPLMHDPTRADWYNYCPVCGKKL
jgi:hypothetical protein